MLGAFKSTSATVLAPVSHTLLCVFRTKEINSREQQCTCKTDVPFDNELQCFWEVGTEPPKLQQDPTTMG